MARHKQGVHHIVYHHLPPRKTVAFVGIVSAALVAGAHAFERLGGLAPCLLCLEQREVHWTAMAVVVAGLVGRMVTGSERLLASFLGGLTLVYLFSAFLAGYHAGVEWGFWPGPAQCAAGIPSTDISGTDLLATLDNAGTLEGPPCEVAMWRLFGISMAGYNALISLGLAGLAALATLSAWRMKFTPQAAAQQEQLA